MFSHPPLLPHQCLPHKASCLQMAGHKSLTSCTQRSVPQPGCPIPVGACGPSASVCTWRDRVIGVRAGHIPSPIPKPQFLCGCHRKGQGYTVPKGPQRANSTQLYFQPVSSGGQTSRSHCTQVLYHKTAVFVSPDNKLPSVWISTAPLV